MSKSSLLLHALVEADTASLCSDPLSRNPLVPRAIPWIPAPPDFRACAVPSPRVTDFAVQPHGPLVDLSVPPNPVIERSSENGWLKSICPASVSASTPSIKICTRPIFLMFWVKEFTTE